jgi:hypothetical protein
MAFIFCCPSSVAFICRGSFSPTQHLQFVGDKIAFEMYVIADLLFCILFSDIVYSCDLKKYLESSEL